MRKKNQDNKRQQENSRKQKNKQTKESFFFLVGKKKALPTRQKNTR